MTWRLLTPGLLLALLPASLTGPPGAAAQGTLAVAPAKAPPEVVLRPQQVRPLPGGLDSVLVLNDNNPELIRSQGILLSSFEPKAVIAGQPLAVPGAHLDLPLQGRFELFSHHVYAGRPESADSTLWLGVVAAPGAPDPFACGWWPGPRRCPSRMIHANRPPLSCPCPPAEPERRGPLRRSRQPCGGRTADPSAPQPAAERAVDAAAGSAHHPAGPAPAGAGPRSPAQRPQPAAAPGE